VKRVLYRADNIVVPSTYLARELSWLGLKFEIIPNTLDLSHYPYRQRSRLEPRLLWMRTFHQTYNPEMALNVLMRVMVLYPQATLTMAGLDAGLQKEIQKLAFNKGLMTHISFPGILDTPAKYLAGQLHDIYLNTNRVDNMPISIIEMAAMGLPIIATNVGGIPDLLTHGETALIVPSNDDQAMAEAVNCLLANPGLVKNLSINARQMAESFTWQKVSPLWDQLFSKVLKDA
jgi:glycosyltransferase involved in cell wall biosynthesis